MTDLTIGGETFNVLIGGDETLPVLMLSNPLGADLHIWDAQIPELIKHFRIVRYNPRGHGSSITDTGPYSIGRLGQDALAILDALGIEKAHWLGMSQGGAVGQWLLINASHRIERAVLANTAAHFGSPDAWNERIVAAQEHGMAALADAVIARWFSTAFAEKHPERVEPVKQALLATSPEGYAAACAALRDMDLREGLWQIQRPVLIIAGADDQSTSPEQAALLAETIPGAKLVTLKTRHISAVEDADGFSKAVVDFLTSTIAVRQTSTRKTQPPRSIARRPAGRRSPMTRGATTDTLARRAPVKGATGKAKAVEMPVITATPAKTSRAKVPVAVSKTAPKRAAAKSPAAAAPKLTLAAAPAKRTATKPTPANAASKTGASKTATRKAAPARQARVAAAPAKTVKRMKTTKAPTAKALSRKALVKAPAPPRPKTHAVKRGAAKPAVVSKKSAKTVAKPTKTLATPSMPRRAPVTPKAAAKRPATAALKARAKPKAKAAPKANAKVTAALPQRKPATKAKATAARAKASAMTTKTAKVAAKPTSRQPAAKAPATRRKG